MSHLTFIEREVIACFLTLAGVVGVILTGTVWSERRLVRRRKQSTAKFPRPAAPGITPKRKNL